MYPLETLLDSPMLKSTPIILMPFLAGLFIGVVTCPSCAFPLGSFVLGRGGDMRVGARMGIFFNWGRLMVFALLGAMWGLLGNLFQDYPFVFEIARSLVLVFLLVFGLEILGIIKNPFNRVGFRKGNDSSFPLILWGGVLGTACFFEFFWIFSAVLLETFATGSVLFGIYGGLSFGLGTAIPSILVAAGSGAAVGIYRRREFLRIFGGVILVSLALLSIPQGYLARYDMLGAGLLAFFLGLFFAGLIARSGIAFHNPRFITAFILGSFSALLVKYLQLITFFPQTFTHYIFPNFILFLIFIAGAMSVMARGLPDPGEILGNVS